MSDAAASDDSDLRNIVHAGTTLAATALAVAEQHGGTGGEDVLAAIVLGYEAAGRIGEAITPGFRDTWFSRLPRRDFCRCCRRRPAPALGGGADGSGDCLVRDLDRRASRSGQHQRGSRVSCRAGGDARRPGRAGGAARLPGRRAHPRNASTGFSRCMAVSRAPRRGRTCCAAWGSPGTSSPTWPSSSCRAVTPTTRSPRPPATRRRDGSIVPDQVESITLSRPGVTSLAGPLHPTDLIGMAHSPAYFLAAGVADHGISWVNATQAKIADPVDPQADR